MGDAEKNAVQPMDLDLRGRFSWRGLGLAILCGAITGVIWAWTAEVVQSYVAPIILFPILLGVCTGLTNVGLARLFQIGHRPTILAMVVLAAVLAGVCQHYFEYRSQYSPFRPMAEGESAAERNLSPAVHELKPSFVKFLEGQANRGRPLVGEYRAFGLWAWMSWAIDALLVVAAAAAVTIPSVREPYCNQCKTWYRTIRCGKIDIPTARRLGELIEAEDIGQIHSPRYRLSCCHGGCGPTRCELSWAVSGGGVDLVCVWLDPKKRNQAATILDGQDCDDFDEE